MSSGRYASMASGQTIRIGSRMTSTVFWPMPLRFPGSLN